MIMLAQVTAISLAKASYPTIFGLPMAPLLVLFGIIVVIIGFVVRHFENKKKRARLEARRAEKAKNAQPVQPAPTAQPVAEKPAPKPASETTTSPRKSTDSPRKSTGSSRRRRTRPEE